MESELGNSNQDASPSATKNTGVVLGPSSHTEACSYSYFWWCRYFWDPWLSFDMADEFSVRVTEIASRIGVSWTHSLPFHFQLILTQSTMAILSKACKPESFESHNSLKLSFTNIWALRSNFVIVNLSLNQTLLTFLLYVRQPSKKLSWELTKRKQDLTEMSIILMVSIEI